MNYKLSKNFGSLPPLLQPRPELNIKFKKNAIFKLLKLAKVTKTKQKNEIYPEHQYDQQNRINMNYIYIET